ncbi:MAG: hypothetical protein RL238_2054 [Actinomycetota bacterium]
MIGMNEIDPEGLAGSLLELGAAWWSLHLPTGRVRASANCAAVLGLGDGAVVTDAQLRSLRPFPARGWATFEAVHPGRQGRVRSRLAARVDDAGDVLEVFGLELPFATSTSEPSRPSGDADADAQLLRDIFDMQPAMAARYRVDGTIVWCNEAYAAHLGTTAGAARDHRWIDLAAAHGHDSVEAMEELLVDIVRTLRGDTTCTVLGPLPGEHGPRWIQWSNRRLPGADVDGGDLVQAVGVEVTELRTARDALDVMARELVRSRVSERRDLARRLHDDVVQVLVSAMWAISPSEKRPVDADTAQRSADLVRMAIDQLRTCLGELTSPPVQRESITAALEVELSALRETGVRIETTIDEVADEELRTVATRVLTEAVRNVVRHARATEVTVTLCTEGEQVVGTITDNGVGARDDDLTRALAAGHVGLLMSRAMVESIGGTFSIHGTTRSGGTTVEFVTPLWPTRRGRSG